MICKLISLITKEIHRLEINRKSGRNGSNDNW